VLVRFDFSTVTTALEMIHHMTLKSRFQGRRLACGSPLGRWHYEQTPDKAATRPSALASSSTSQRDIQSTNVAQAIQIPHWGKHELQATMCAPELSTSNNSLTLRLDSKRECLDTIATSLRTAPYLCRKSQYVLLQLSKLATSEEECIRRSAADQLIEAFKRGFEVSFENLEQLASSRDDYIRRQVTDAWCDRIFIASDDEIKRTIPILNNLAQSDDEHTRRSATHALCWAAGNGSDLAIHGVEELSQHKDKEVRQKVSQVLCLRTLAGHKRSREDTSV